MRTANHPSFSSPLRMSTATVGGHRVLSVGGELDAATIEAFSAAADDLLAQCPATAIIDLSDVSFCSAGTLGSLLRLTGDAHSHSTPLAIVAAHPAVLRPIRLLGLWPVLPLHAALADATAWLDIVPRLLTGSGSRQASADRLASQPGL